MTPKIAKVVLSIALDKELDYRIPACVNIQRGVRVLVDFRGRKLVGIVVATKQKSNIPNLKHISDILDTQPYITNEHLVFAKRLSALYPYSMAGFLFMMLPAYLHKPKKIKFNPAACQPKRRHCQYKCIKASGFLERYHLWKESVRESLKQGSVLILFPQVAYLKEAQTLIEKDSLHQVSVIHSYRTAKEILNEWQCSRTNALILGTRAALFLYPRDLRLIIVEDENSPYYFHEERPFYHLIDVVHLLSKIRPLDILLSSEYPSLSTYKHVKKKECKLIDSKMHKQEIKIIGINRTAMTLNPILVELVRKYIASGKRLAVIFNKTGYALRLACSACGHIFKCEHCSSSLRLSATSNKGFCPYCTKTYTIPSNCPYCQQGYIKSSGTGVQKLNALLKGTFPELTIADWENRSRAAHITVATSKILSCLYGCESFDVGFLLDIDSFFWRLDYDAAFVAFIYAQKLATFFQEAFYIFTENPTHYIFTLLNRPWQEFYEKELAFRRGLSLPPFGLVVTITLRAANENRLLKRAENLYNKLKEQNFKVYGPLKEQPFKLRNNFRYSLILKLSKGCRWHRKIKNEIRNLHSSQIKIAVSIRQ